MQNHAKQDDDVISFLPENYPNMGLSHSLSHLTKKYNTIHMLPIEEQSQYADAICRKVVKNQSYEIIIRRNLKHETKSPMFHHWNVTAVGNLAYICLHSNDEKIKQASKALLLKYKSWRKREWWTDLLIKIIIIIIIIIFVYKM